MQRLHFDTLRADVDALVEAARSHSTCGESRSPATSTTLQWVVANVWAGASELWVSGPGVVMPAS